MRQRQCQHNTHKFNTTGRNINTYIDNQPSGGRRRMHKAATGCCSTTMLQAPVNCRNRSRYEYW
jgi:hypothetical protein